jgi:adenine C2-methylase RlmN of 23S rRNA A2503 and tRNA A37
MKIADIDFGKYPIFLAPMEDVTDAAFRLLCKRFGVDMVYTEFVSSDALIRDVNDSRENALELASRLKGWLTHVNLIPLNEVEGREYKTASGQNVLEFRKVLEEKGIAVTVRRTLGSDIDAACGQLRARSK